ncbi:unnamed protein product [Musa acuminata subsp. malaccensis]|uniref:(wild Malaysian banana) hypothetical protein n=1 Tax=Musa acuminata subsp. malaccensis TaxID=214687 RepID=A0A804JD01_MUSAM|nr:PREDICTED: uncharacterized protein LOC103986903 [Musa acuminata subsp. malaccensis]XP_018683569.1 PREDICTED: uncharacterized protein LOC103986903 [Musa acuminata subsp. malaccensis]XP_018683570.1 PREDICTED: uncharacterized protein LOC103986903 [Musa acuminata subsp. malaccensis]XP_018683571.1 PREDICTED: uncharacterized protein LOC103986903 [Musa acuminata subsp. malaccensis]CAG1845370.1 unnamed protein product [Musa acuminata subsp. malaccensis]
MELGATAVAAADDSSPRVKLLCSFGGSILPRPLDGRLRYVGGENRILTVPRDVSYEDLLARIRELFDAVSIIKYQQPEEDLDALVSVVNDDDVMNMMEEYDKLSATGDGVMRLRIFLFSHYPDLDVAGATTHFDNDERETERRYIDALNSLSDNKSPSPPDTSDHYLGHPGIDGGILHGQLNLHHIAIPHPSHVQRYGEMDAPYSPAFFSPGPHAVNDPQEFPSSPSSAIFHLGAGELSDRIADEYLRQAGGHQLCQFDHQSPPTMENVMWLPAGAIIQENSGFPTNLAHAQNMIESNRICEHCHMTFQRSHTTVSDARFVDTRWKHGQPYMEQPNMMNEYVGQFPNSSAECFGGRDPCMVNQDMKIDHGICVKEQNEPHHPFYNEYDQGRAIHNHQFPQRLEDLRIHHSGTGRVNEHYIIDGTMMNVPFSHGNVNDVHSFPSNCIGHDNGDYLRHGTNIGNEALLSQQTVGGGTGTNAPGFEDTEVQYHNQPLAYGVESPCQASNNLHPIQSLWRNRQAPSHPGTSYEPSNMMMPNGAPDSGFIRYMQEGSPTLPYVRVEDQIPNALSSQNNSIPQRMLGLDESAASDYLNRYGPRQNPNVTGQDGMFSIAHDYPGEINGKVPTEAVPLVHTPPYPVEKELIVSSAFAINHPPVMASNRSVQLQVAAEINLTIDGQKIRHEVSKKPDEHRILSPTRRQNLEFAKNGPQLSEVEGHPRKSVDADINVSHRDRNMSEENLNFLPELIASVKKAVLEGAEEAVAKVQSNSCLDIYSPLVEKESLCEHENAYADVQPDSKAIDEHEQICKTDPRTDETEALTKGLQNSDVQLDPEGNSEHDKLCKIEPTTAEAEALAKGLQTIKNDDLEEIRELGSGTFGSVYYGKWRGSDVAIKRIKASCFAGRPSERERLIADFWKEALIMSCLHHPNVVSFYGVVRDGPGGSLATVTEFMVNGSLKQFLQKKDRTIDRRKRLIIAMDVAFGMEYLHGKNIVHFDLKCENLLVNMRDPHRPICKIGDLGLSKVKQHTLVSGGLRGTLPWMAPELLSGKSNMVSEKIDVYSFGIVMWELLTGEEPYADMRCASIIGGIVNNSIRPKIPSWCDPEWKSLMESCWSSDPALRPSFSEISQKLRKMAAAINLK